jgi:putative ABC transport system permease protein
VGSASAVTGRAVWLSVPPDGIALAVLLALIAGSVTTGIRILRLRAASRQSEVAVDRRLLERGWQTLWKRARLDVVFIVLGAVILLINALAGGLRHGPVEGPSLALSFYVLLAPLFLWIGGTLLLVRLLLAALAIWSRPDRARPLSSWPGTALRWLGRRPAQTAVALTLGALAVAFGTDVLAFAATYQTARETDARAALGSDMRITPGDPRFTLPDLGPDVAAVTPVRLVPARVDTDRKMILAIDPATFASAATIAPRIVAGEGTEALIANPRGVLVNSEIADLFGVAPGDMLPLTIFPDDYENAKDIELKVLGVFAAFPPTLPATELVTTTAALPRALTIKPDFYLARVALAVSPPELAIYLRIGAFAD